MIAILNTLLSSRRGGSTEHPGLTLLKEESYIYADFNALAQADGEEITTPLSAFGTEGVTLSPLNSPLVESRLINGSLYKTLKDETTKCVTTGINFADIVNKNFEVWFAISGGNNDGGTQNFQVCGAVFTADTNRQFLVYISSNEIRLNWGYTGTRFVYRTTVPVVSDNYGLTVVCLRVNFDNDTVTTLVNGVAVSGTFSSGTIAGKDPALFDNTNTCFIASGNNGDGTAISGTDGNQFFHDFAIKPISSTEQTALIFEYLTSGKYE
jgi:hypothetical protein